MQSGRLHARTTKADKLPEIVTGKLLISGNLRSGTDPRHFAILIEVYLKAELG